MKLEPASQPGEPCGGHSSELARRLGEAVDRMPAFPNSVQKIFQLTRDVNCETKDLVSVIEKDPVMTVKILRVINSAYYNLPNKVTTINRSVVYLGANTIKNLALSIATIGIFPRQNKAGFDMQAYLFHSLHVAGVARSLCAKADADVSPMDCYVAGLLHDFGKVVFAQFMPEEFKEALTISRERNLPMHLAEQEAIGCDHTLAGSMLAEKWQFPVPLVESIRRHHDVEDSASAMSTCVFLANRISRKVLAAPGADPAADELPPAVAARCGASLDEIVAALDLAGIGEEARMFSQMGAAA